ncbi:MAG TPA: formaldehyde-activating enzyme [Acidimicrobiales bacterium]
MSRPTPRTEYGECFVGDGPDAAHLNTVLGPRGSAVETAWVTALATPRQGHAAFVVTAVPGVAVRPHTLFVNKAPIENDGHGRVTWGAAQAGVAAGVMDAVRDGVIDPAAAAELLLIAAAWVNPAAADEQAVFENNRQATVGALAAGQADRPTVAEALTAALAPSNAFFAGPASS